MGRRARRRGGAPFSAADSSHVSAEHGELVLRGALTPRTRREYDRLRSPASARAAATADDVWARSFEFLFERLAVRWTVQGVAWEGQKDLLARYRAASADERRWLRAAIGAHLAEHFPDMEMP